VRFGRSGGREARKNVLASKDKSEGEAREVRKRKSSLRQIPMATNSARLLVPYLGGYVSVWMGFCEFAYGALLLSDLWVVYAAGVGLLFCVAVGGLCRWGVIRRL